jgi:hypothetical protein
MLSAYDQPGSQGIALHIAHDRYQVMVLLDQKCFEAALPYAAARLVLPMMATHMCCKQPMRPSGEVVSPHRTHDEVHMVWHEAGCEDRQFEMVLGLPDQREKCGVVGGFVKDGRLVVASVDEVVTAATDDGARGTRHPMNVVRSQDCANEIAFALARIRE